MFDELIWILLLVLGIAALVLFGVIRLIWHFVKNRHSGSGVPDYLKLALSPQDAVGQLLIVLGFAFLMLSLLAFDRQLGYPLPWQTLLLLVSAAGIVVGYWQKLLYPAVLGGLGLMIWFGAQGGIWTSASNTQALGILVGVGWLGLIWYVFGAVVDQHPKWRRFATSGFIIGTIVSAALLFFFSTNWGLEALQELSRGGLWYGSAGVASMLLIILIILFGLGGYGISRKALRAPEAITVLGTAVLFGLLLLIGNDVSLFSSTYDYYGPRALSALGIAIAIIYNIGIFAALICVVLSGYIRHESWRISLGAVLMFLLILVKYFDWFFTFLDKSVFFLGAGLILFIVGWMMERGRRYMVASLVEGKTN